MSAEEILPYLAELPEGGLHFKQDPDSQLTAIVALHSTRIGPALGGCRMVSYPHLEAAIQDAVRLAKGMTYKAAIAGTHLGGGKAVIIKPDGPFDREKLLLSFARFVHQLGGQYITAVDSGTRQEDMDVVARVTPHVTCKTPLPGFLLGDPSPFTALGVLSGIEAAVQFADQKTDLTGLTVAIQGLGHVGWSLAELLHKRGAQLYVTDIDGALIRKAVTTFQAIAVETDAIYDVPVDVFSPCALGGILHENTIPRLRCRIVAGGANNQLKIPQDADHLMNRQILYAPDYVINSGGLIHAEVQYHVATGQMPASLEAEERARLKLSGIGETLGRIFSRSTEQHLSTACVADQLAEERLSAYPL